MNRPLLGCALLFALSTSAFAADGKKKPLTATPVCSVVSNVLPAGLDFRDRPFHASQSGPGLLVSFMVEGEDIVGIKNDGVSVGAILTPDGKNVTNHPNGARAWDMGAFPKASADGSCLFFDVEFHAGRKNLVGIADGCTIDGKAIVLTSSGARKVKKEHLKVGDTFKESGLSFKVNSTKQLQVTGDLKAIVGDGGEITFTVGGKQTKSNGWSEDGNTRVYSFGDGGSFFTGQAEVKKAAPAAPPATNLTVEFSVWQNIKENIVPFHFGKASAGSK